MIHRSPGYDDPDPSIMRQREQGERDVPRGPGPAEKSLSKKERKRRRREEEEEATELSA